MAHNFKRLINGAFYVSKSGHDSNDGLSPDTPKRTLTQSNFVNGATIVVGAGHYTEGSFTTANWSKNILGDGKVIVDGLTSVVNNGYNQQTYIDDINVEYRNMTVSARQSQLGALILKNCKISGYVTSSSFKKSLIINSEFIMAGAVAGNPVQSIVIGCTGATTGVSNSYVDKLTELTLYDANIGIAYSNYRGVFILKGTCFADGVSRKYAIKDQQTGTPFDNSYPADVKWFSGTQLTADGYNGTTTQFNNGVSNIATCINREPLFNNEAIEDFTLQAGSPHIGRASDGSNIGGTELAISIINTDHNGGSIKVIPSPAIDTSIPDSYKLNAGEIEGYVDYLVKIGTKSLIINEISPISLLNFNSDEPNGSAGNNNVPDSEPLTLDYPRMLITTSASADAVTLNITGHDVVVGEWVRVLGESREVTAITENTVTVGTAFRAAIGTGVEVRAASLINLSATNPNRLTYLMRTSKEDNPVLDSDWDNDIAAIYNMAGQFLTQEWDKKPGYVIDILNGDAVYGSGDSQAPTDQPVNFISCKWINIRVYIRNNYDS